MRSGWLDFRPTWRPAASRLFTFSRSRQATEDGGPGSKVGGLEVGGWRSGVKSPQPLTSNLRSLVDDYHFTCAPNPIMRGCMTELANPTDELSTLLVTVLMIASELFTLNISSVGSTVNRLTLNDFWTLRSS